MCEFQATWSYMIGTENTLKAKIMIHTQPQSVLSSCSTKDHACIIACTMHEWMTDMPYEVYDIVLISLNVSIYCGCACADVHLQI